MGGIFISYRREDSGPYAGRLRDALSHRFGANQVFRDIDRINPGERVPRVIEREVGSCQALLAVIGPTWLSIKDDAGERRLNDPEDYVRLEIATALGRSDVLVIPVLVGPTSMPSAAEMPKQLAPLAECNAVRITDESWDDQVARLTRALEKVVQRPEERFASAPARPVAFHTPPPPSGGPMWTAPPPGPPGPPPAGTKIPWIPIVAGAAVLVLGAVGIWFLVKPDDSSSTGMPSTKTTTETEPTETTRRTPRTTTPTVDPDSFDGKLLAMLPRGYDEGVCRPVDPPATGALATVDCGPASPIGGPMSARYSLFADQPSLDTHFDESIGQNSELRQCPGSGVDSPTTWHYTDTPDKVEGRIACGTYNNNADVMWTKNADLLLADAKGTNLEDLHNWWLRFG